MKKIIVILALLLAGAAAVIYIKSEQQSAIYKAYLESGKETSEPSPKFREYDKYLAMLGFTSGEDLVEYYGMTKGGIPVDPDELEVTPSQVPDAYLLVVRSKTGAPFSVENNEGRTLFGQVPSQKGSNDVTNLPVGRSEVIAFGAEGKPNFQMKKIMEVLRNVGYNSPNEFWEKYFEGTPIFLELCPDNESSCLLIHRVYRNELFSLKGKSGNTMKFLWFKTAEGKAALMMTIEHHEEGAFKNLPESKTSLDTPTPALPQAKATATSVPKTPTHVPQPTATTVPPKPTPTVVLKGGKSLSPSMTELYGLWKLLPAESQNSQKCIPDVELINGKALFSAAPNLGGTYSYIDNRRFQIIIAGFTHTVIYRADGKLQWPQSQFTNPETICIYQHQ